jgi:hypothetical protein
MERRSNSSSLAIATDRLAGRLCKPTAPVPNGPGHRPRRRWAVTMSRCGCDGRDLPRRRRRGKLIAVLCGLVSADSDADLQSRRSTERPARNTHHVACPGRWAQPHRWSMFSGGTTRRARPGTLSSLTARPTRIAGRPHRPMPASPFCKSGCASSAAAILSKPGLARGGSPSLRSQLATAP